MRETIVRVLTFLQLVVPFESVKIVIGKLLANSNLLDILAAVISGWLPIPAGERQLTAAPDADGLTRMLATVDESHLTAGELDEFQQAGIDTTILMQIIRWILTILHVVPTA